MPRDDLLSLPPEQASRLTAIARLDEAVDAHRRLADPDDPEGLHDFRVALRRLRACLRAYREQLGDEIPRKLRKRLRALAASTGTARDTEVEIGWLRAQTKTLRPHERYGLSWFLLRLEARARAAQVEMDRRLPAAFSEVEKDLRERLATYSIAYRLDQPHEQTRFAETLGALVLRHAARLETRLTRISAAGDRAEIHTARIAVKQLRYLIEPFAPSLVGGVPLVRRLKALQDLLGDLHDAHVLWNEIAAAVQDAAVEKARRVLELTLDPGGDEARLRAAQRRDARPGLVALARRNKARQDEMFAALQAARPDGRIATLIEEARTLAALLDAPDDTRTPDDARSPTS